MSDKYRALVGLNYPPAKRADAGDVVSDLPEKSIKWLLKAGKIEKAGNQPPPATADTTKDGDR
jgi:hypothetical protein